MVPDSQAADDRDPDVGELPQSSEHSDYLVSNAFEIGFGSHGVWRDVCEMWRRLMLGARRNLDVQ